MEGLGTSAAEPGRLARARLSAIASALALACALDASCGEAPSQVQAAPGDELELERALAELAEARAEIERLSCELARETERRVQREEEWLRYTTALSALDLEGLPGELDLAPDDGAPETPPSARAEPSEEELALRRRNEEVARSLRSLLAIEEVRGLDLLEAGALHEGCTGPVVFRLLDGDGRLAGSLCAERLRLEGSRAARTLALVLEDGYETRGGVRTEFAAEPAAALAPRGPSLSESSPPGLPADGEPQSVRRIVLPRVDPLPWMETLPELFGGRPLDEPIDDGLWSLALVRGSLNRLLREDVLASQYRLRSLGGVRAGVLRDVHLEVLDSEGKLERSLFADRLTIERQERGLLLSLESGAQVRGDVKTAFLDGRFRIFLPRADVAAWEAARLPGLASSDAAPRER